MNRKRKKPTVTSLCVGTTPPGRHDHRGVPSPPPTATSHPSLPVAFRSILYIEKSPPGDDRWAAHLKVDYDSTKSARSLHVPNPLRFSRIRRFACVDLVRLSGGRLSRTDVVDARVYRTRRGHHLRVFFRPNMRRLPAETILAMHAALGDDVRRQEMNVARVARNHPGWSVLWTQKYVNGELVGEEVLDRVLTARVREIFGVKSKTKNRVKKKKAGGR